MMRFDAPIPNGYFRVLFNLDIDKLRLGVIYYHILKHHEKNIWSLNFDPIGADQYKSYKKIDVSNEQGLSEQCRDISL